MLKKFILLFFLFYNLHSILSLQCSKVAEFPPNLKTLMPDYEKLSKIHLNEYFFLDQEQSKFTFHIPDVSILKILLVPRHFKLQVEIVHDSQLVHSLIVDSHIPLDISDFSGIKGEIEMKFTNLVSSTENTHLDEFCNSPYIKMEFVIQKIESFKEKLKEVHKSNTKLSSFELDFEQMLHNLPVDTEIGTFKLPLVTKESSKYENYQNVTILKEFELVFNEIKGKEKDSLQKYELKMEMTSDFLLTGSTYIVLSRDEDKDIELEDLKCLSDGKCIISERNNKNNMIFHSSMTPGHYRLYLIDIQSKESLKKLSKYIDAVPLGFKIKLYTVEQEDEKYICDGKRLPKQIFIENMINFKDNYEINEEIIMDLKTLSESTLIKTESDSMLRVIASHMSGLKINLELMKGNTTLEKTEGLGDATGLVYSLKKGEEYSLNFEYENSILDELKSGDCPKFHLRLGILSVDYARSLNKNENNCGENKKSVFGPIDHILSELNHIEPSKNGNHIIIEDNEKYSISIKNDLQRSFEVLYDQEFEINHNTLLNFDVLSDFTSGLIVPYIIPAGDKAKDKMNIIEKLGFLTGTLNINLKKGKYNFYLIYGKNQFSDSAELSVIKNFREATQSFPHCVTFQVRLTAFILEKQLKNWECNNIFMNYLPNSFNNNRDLGINNLKDHFIYYSKSLLIPEATHSVKFSTSNQYYFLKMSYEQNLKEFELDIKLKQGGKVLKTAKPFKHKTLQSTQSYLTYLLKPNREYELEFNNISDHVDHPNPEVANFHSYFENCKLVEFHLEFTSKNFLESTRNPRKCEMIIPKIEEVFYERLVGVPNSFFRYGDRRKMWGLRRDDPKEKSEDFDLETKNNKIFQFQKTQKPFKHSYQFEIHYLVSRLSAKIEINFDTSLMIYVSRRTESNTAVIASGEITGLNTVELKPISLEGGKYELTIIETNYNKNINKKFNFCEMFTLSVLIEDKPFNYFTKALTLNKDAHSNPELCNVDPVPENLNFPGLIYPDSDYSINDIYRFLLTEKEQYTKFFVVNKSLFKLNILPFNDNTIHEYVKIYKEHRGKRKLVAEIRKNQDLHINEILPKGVYNMEISFRGPEDSLLKDTSKNCQSFEMYLSVIPITTMLGDEKNLEKNVYCEEKFVTGKLMPNTNQNYSPIVFNKKAAEKSDDIVNPFLIQLNAPTKNGKFIGEFIYNNVLDTVINFEVNKVHLNNKSGNNDVHHVPYTSIFNDNFAWIIFNVEPEYDFLIKLHSSVYSKEGNVCSKMFFSYSYMDEEGEIKVDPQSGIEKEEVKKEICKINDYLPENLYTQDTILDKYGGHQLEDGTIKLIGEFLVPHQFNQKRISFNVIKDSVLYVKIVPKFVENNNVQLQIYRDKNLIYRYAHSIVNGVILTSLTAYNSAPYLLEMIFDPQNSHHCNSFEFIFTLVPKEVYLKDHVSCEEKFDNIPQKIELEKNMEESYLNSYSIENNKLQFLTDENKNSEFIIDLNLTKMFTLNIYVKFLISDNLMDIMLTDLQSDEIIEEGKESVARSEDYDGILVTKSINANLKPGKYKITLVHMSIYNEMVKNILPFGQKNTYCQPFLFDISAVSLEGKIKHQERQAISDETEQDREESSAEIEKVEKKDLVNSNIENFIINVNPAKMKHIKLRDDFTVFISFEFDLDKQTDFSRGFYLQEIEVDKVVGNNKIFPGSIKVSEKKNLKVTFDRTSLQSKKCYKLVYDFLSISSSSHKFIDDDLDHIYCTINCSCNPYSEFKCTESGKCKCRSPYTGEKCDKCEDGFSYDGKYCTQNIKKCDDKVDCNYHGKCKINPENNKKYCDCDEGFASTDSKFCNVCSDPSKIYPFCTEKYSEKETLAFNWDSNCGNDGKGGYSLPENLFDENNEHDKFFGAVQHPDGSVNFHSVLVARKEIEYTQIKIPENSLIRVFFLSREINRAKVQLLQSEDDVEPLAFTDGVDPTESFLAKLDERETPFVIKLIHTGMKSTCTKYELIINIKPINLVFSNLKCDRKFKKVDNLPEEKMTMGEGTTLKEYNSFIIPESLIINYKRINKNAIKKKKDVFFTRTGVLSKGLQDEEFIYNIEIDVVSHPVILTMSVDYDFLTNDLELFLRDKEGKVIKKSEYLIPVIEEQIQNHNLVSSISHTLEPGTYFLTMIQGVSANMLVQILNDDDTFKDKKKCFSFNMHTETIMINKPDPGISTSKYEAMFNRVIDVEPPSMNNLNTDKKFEIFITFEDSLKTFTKDKKGNLSDAFYLENEKTKSRINPKHTYVQGSRSNKFLLFFKKKTLEKDTCYDLKFNLDLLVSVEEDKKLMDDSPIVHRFCTKNCDCNPFTDFECDENGKCICESPYTGHGCYSCEKDFIMAHYRCINPKNCQENYCNGYGTCIQHTDKPDSYPSCECEEDFRGSEKCDQCTNNQLTFPNCSTEEKLKEKIKEKSKKHSIEEEYKSLEKEDSGIVTAEKDSYGFDCNFQMIPIDLDSLGFLQLNGHMHVAGLYSLKHIDNKHYSTKFTIKERSHFKIYLEFTKKSHIIVLVLKKGNNVIKEGNIHLGPAGNSTSSYLDIIIDPYQESGKYLPYELNYFIKDTLSNIDNISAETIQNQLVIPSDCFNAFVEIQISSIRDSHSYPQVCNQKNPTIFPQDSTLTENYNNFPTTINEKNEFQYDRDKYDSSSTIYFYHDYFYVPDLLNKDLVFFFQVISKFIDSHIGVMLEVLDIPDNLGGKKIDHHRLTTRQLKEYFKDVKEPECKSHCFSGYKKLNSVVLDRKLPPDSFWRIWLYDLSPKPINAGSADIKKCINYEVLFYHNYETTENFITSLRRDKAICVNDFLPSNLNTRNYVGNKVYFMKWGFHTLDMFRIDHVTSTSFIHDSTFEIENYALFRIVVENNNVDIDLELIKLNNNTEEVIAKSTAREFENSIAIEIPEGKYILRYKFFPKTNGFHNCESIKQEFSIHYLNFLQENIERNVAKHNNKQKTMVVNIGEHLKNVNNQNIFHQNKENTYIIEHKPAFVIDKDDMNSYEASVVVSEFSFVVEEVDSHKLELVSYVASDFSFIDVSLYLFETNTQKTIQAVHTKNKNVLISGPLPSGSYIFALRYYRRLHYLNKDGKPGLELNRANFAEIEFNASFLNKSGDTVTLLTSGNKLKIKPTNQKAVYHDWFCRNYGSPIPKTLNSLRFLEFTKDMHIIDNYIIPPLGEAEEKISFTIKHLPKLMIRVYVESKEVDIDVKLLKHLSGGKYEEVSDSLQNAHFATLMAILEGNFEYEIVLKFKSNNIDLEDCKTFKMEIATEISHNYACSDTSKSSLLTDLKPIPEILPLPDKKEDAHIYKYTSKDNYPNTHEGSGYVYMMRTEKDLEYKFASFETTEEIDFRLEISFDFMQAPINIFLTPKLSEHKSDKRGKENKINDSNIIAFGDIFENRNVLLVKNLPVGYYNIYIYLPGLRTHFKYEKVCSLYDVLFEAKSSKSHVLNGVKKQLHNIKDENLDLPIPMPVNLNSFWNEENYMNHHNYFYFVRTGQLSDQIIETITLNIPEESIVRFLVENISSKENELVMSIKGKTDFNDSIYTVLEKGDYVLELKETLKNKSELTNNNLTKNTFLFFVGISSTKRINEIYNYNGIQSTSHQCQTTILPTSLDSGNEENGTLHFHNKKILFNSKDLNGKNLAKIKLEIRQPSRLVVDISTDVILNPLELKITSTHEEWMADWSENVGYLNLKLPTGTYDLHIDLEFNVVNSNLSCILFGLNLHIFDIKKNIQIHDVSGHKGKGNKDIVSTQCDTTEILPLEISSTAIDPSSRITHEGLYLLHLNKVLYYVHQTISSNSNNPNNINLVIDRPSLIRITASVPEPKEYQILPKLKMRKIKSNPSKKHKPKMIVNEKISEVGSFISHNLEDRNLAYMVKENTSDNYYRIELRHEVLDQFKEESHSSHCPYYKFDLLINSIDDIIKTYKCPEKEGKIIEAQLPSQKVVFNNNKFNQQIDFSYFTEEQLSTYYKSNEADDNIFQYFIPFEIKEKSLISVEFGYSHLISLFDIYLSKYEGEDSFESRVVTVGISVFRDFNVDFPYRKIINTTIEPGKYVLILSDSMWSGIHSHILSMKLESMNNVHLCLPFLFNIDIQKAEEESMARPEIIYVYPQGPVVFIGEEEEIKVMIKLNKNVFTSSKQSISQYNNFAYLISSFYLAEKVTDTQHNTKDNEALKKVIESEEEIQKIFADKIQGSEDGKEWELIFLNKTLKKGHDYTFKMINRMLYDLNHMEFTCNKIFPTFRLESSYEEQINLAEDNEKLKKKFEDVKINATENPSDYKYENITSVETESQQVQNVVSHKCGKHGKEVFDNMVRKWLCSCTDGYTGKYCNICNGKVEPGTERCVILDDEEEDVKNDSGSTTHENSHSDTSSSENHHQIESHEPTHETHKPVETHEETKSRYSSYSYNGNKCGGCEQGFCDAKSGRCICNDGWTGPHCDRRISLINKPQTNAKLLENRDSSYSGNIYWKMLIYFIGIIFIFFVYKTVRKHYFASRHSEYSPLERDEFFVEKRGLEDRKLELFDNEANFVEMTKKKKGEGEKKSLIKETNYDY